MLWINDAHPANDDDIRYAAYVAKRFFEAHYQDPEEVWISYQNDDPNASALWNEAEFVAFKTLFAGWAEWPDSASMVYE